MKYFSISILMLLFSFQNLSSSEIVANFLKNIPKNDSLIVDWFFQKMVHTGAEYVIYGDKPMSIWMIRNDPVNLHHGEWVAPEKRFSEILREWELNSLSNKRYVFITCNKCNYIQLLSINRIAFEKVVNDNIELFRYVTGRPGLTGQILLSDLIENKDQFYEIIKDDVTLLGILLGYGTDNAVAQSRYELLTTALSCPILEFPYVKNPNPIKPSLGFNSLQEELDSDKRIVSRTINPHDDFPIPYFACYPNSEETSILLSTYERNREEILAILNQNNFLERFLERIFTTTSNEIRLPSIQKPNQSTFHPEDKKDSARKLAEVARAETNINELDQNNLVQIFLKGIDDSEKGVKPDFKPTYLSEVKLLEENLREAKNLEKAELLLNKYSKSKGWIPLIEKNIVYKVLKKGTGSAASALLNEVTFHYSFRSSSSQKEILAGTVCKGKLEDLIPGIAYSLIGMKQGEERMVYIHPRYAYGDSWPFTNEGILAKVHLVHFKEGLEEAKISKERSLDSRFHHIIDSEAMGTLVVWVSKENPTTQLDEPERIREKPKGSYKEILALYQKAKEEEFYFTGRRFWESLKNHNILIDLNEFKKHINECEKRPLLKTADEKIAFLNDFKIHIFLDLMSGYNPPPVD